MAQEGTAAASLEGRTLKGHWKVLSHINPGPEATGGFFSESYEVEDPEGNRAFLKALDYSWALKQPNSAETLQALTQTYLFERDLLRECSDAHMSRVVLALDYGEEEVEGHEPLSKVNYLIFELAKRDARKHRDLLSELDVAWSLRSLHQVATGLNQLHGRGITHQDLKPSNVLVFGDDYSSKVGDLGRANWQGHASPHEDEPIAGDRMYAPPELLYGFIDSDSVSRRRACDMYHLGSMLSFMFTGVGTTGALAAVINPSQRWDNWGETFDDVLPFIRDSFDEVASLVDDQLPHFLRDELSSQFRQLCDPDPRLRGDTRARPGTVGRYALQRYISRFDRVAREAEIRLKRAILP